VRDVAGLPDGNPVLVKDLANEVGPVLGEQRQPSAGGMRRVDGHCTARRALRNVVLSRNAPLVRSRAAFSRKTRS
jgi:hypothetical protein